MTTPPPTLDEKYIFMKNPMAYLRDFTGLDSTDANKDKKVSEIYNFDESKFTKKLLLDDAKYELKLFSMDIDNELLDITKNPCTNPTNVTIDLKNNVVDSSNIAVALNELHTSGTNKLSFYKSCNTTITINNPPPPPPPPGPITINNTFTESLKTLLQNITIDKYNIINFQDITSSNVEVVTDNNLKIDNTSKSKLTRIDKQIDASNKDKYLTTYYDNTKLELLGYKIINLQTNPFIKLSIILLFKIPLTNRLLLVENSNNIINGNKNLNNSLEGFKLFNDTYKTNILKTNILKTNIFNIDAIDEKTTNDILDDTTTKPILESYETEFYKKYYIYTGKVVPGSELIDTSKVNNYYQNINEVKYNNKFEVKNHNIVLFDHNLRMEHSGSDNSKPFDKNTNKFVNKFDDTDETDTAKLKILKYLGTSKSFGMAVDFSLKDEEFKFDNS